MAEALAENIVAAKAGKQRAFSWLLDELCTTFSSSV